MKKHIKEKKKIIKLKSDLLILNKTYLNFYIGKYVSYIFIELIIKNKLI